MCSFSQHEIALPGSIAGELPAPIPASPGWDTLTDTLFLPGVSGGNCAIVRGFPANYRPAGAQTPEPKKRDSAGLQRMLTRSEERQTGSGRFFAQMRTKMYVVLGAAMLGVATLFAALPALCLDLSAILGNGNQQDLNTFKIIHVADLKTMAANSKDPVHIYDANDPDTRAQFGMIPGATPLKSSEDYDLAVMPSDKDAKVVFYCTNVH
jgi:hypothetical protein